VATTQLPVKPQAGTMPTPVATFPTQTSVLGSVPPVVTSVSAPPVLTTAQATFPTVITSVAPVANVTAAPAAPIVVIKQPQPMKPYTSQTSWKYYKEYFTCLALCNGWTTGAQKAQNLLKSNGRCSCRDSKGTDSRQRRGL